MWELSTAGTKYEEEIKTRSKGKKREQKEKRGEFQKDNNLAISLVLNVVLPPDTRAKHCKHAIVHADQQTIVARRQPNINHNMLYRRCH